MEKVGVKFWSATTFFNFFSCKFIGHPISVNLTFNKPTLICTSTGGPATYVIWKKNQTEVDGTMYQQSQIITNTVNAEYMTTLTLPMTSIPDFDSTYECIVENSRGSGNASLKLEGIFVSEVFLE